MRNFWTGVIVFLVMLISIWIQQNILNNIPLFGVKANIGIILVVALSTLCGQAVGMTIGATYGLLIDILFGKAFGVYTLLFFFVGFFCGKISRDFSKENRTAIIMVTISATIVFEVISYVVFMMIYNYEFVLTSIIKVVGLEVLYHILLARLCFNLFSNLAEIINRGKRSYYLL